MTKPLIDAAQALQDIRSGMSVRGIRTKVGRSETLLVGGDEFGEYASFALDATCK